MQQLSLRPDQWKNAKRVLYMTHLAIGDYYYQRTFLSELKQHYPHIELDIWIDDCRSRPKPWHAGRNQILCQWLESEPHLRRIYPICASRKERKEMIARASQENYDIVIFMAHTRTENFARFARKICPNGWVAGTHAKPFEKWLRKWWAFRQVDYALSLDAEPQTLHINEKYQQRFAQLFGLVFPEKLPPLALSVPDIHLANMQQWLDDFKSSATPKTQRIVVLNHLSTNHRRDLPDDHVVELLIQLHQQHPDCGFVLNVPPNAIESTTSLIKQHTSLAAMNISLFTAAEHFFQLPALLSLCDAVITVETAVMHLASGLNVPQIVLMRANASPWQPLRANEILLGKHVVADIPVTDITNAFNRVMMR